MAPDPIVEPVPWGLHSSVDVLLAGAVFAGLVSARDGGFVPSVASEWSRGEHADAPAGTGESWIFRLDPEARFADGTAVEPRDVIRSWERLIRSPLSPYRFLLDPVVGAALFRDGGASGIAGLAAEGRDLRISLAGPTPDLLARLAHPALGVARADPPDGAGPFAVDPRAAGVSANPFAHPGPYLDRLTIVESAGVGAALLLAAGEVDAVVAFGREAGEIARDPGGAQLRRLPAWDRTYAIALSPEARPLMDDEPLRGALRLGIDRDRDGLLALLFDGRGDPARSLLPRAAPPGPAAAALEGRRGVALSYDRDDPLAASLAARVKAAWEQVGVDTKIEGIPALDHIQRMQDGAFEAALILHCPPTADPVLALRGTLSPVLAGHPEVAAALDAAARLAGPGARLEAARRAEGLLTGNASLIPIVRLHAWLAADPGLVLDGGDTLRLPAIGWRR